MRLILLTLFFPVCLISQNSKKYPSLLWKISGNGTKKPSYLYGTMHVSNRVAWYLSEQFFGAIKNVDVVGLETNPGEWLANMEKTGELDELSMIRGASGLKGDFYRNTFTATFPEKRMLQGILSYDPDIINGLLYRQNRSRENFEENTYIDLFIFQAASKLGKKVISLEDFAQSEIKARLSSMPDEPEENKLRNIFTNSQRIEDAYRAGDLDMLDSLSRLVSSGNTQKYLIEERNVFFVNTIDSVLKHQTLFSGVGAAHLPGPKGVIELLRKKGFIVEPVSPDITTKSSVMKDKIEHTFLPVKLSKQFVADSLFSVDVPGKLYSIVNIGNLRYYINADMVNGNFYTVVRLKHIAPLYNISPENLKKRIDSLLFENIPGKIISRKNIVSNTGYPGIEVHNRTRKGDEQRYRIFFSDIEMTMFKLGGQRDFASGKDADRFFNSIRFYAHGRNFTAFQPATGGFSVSIPAQRSYIHNDGSNLAGLVEDLFAYDGSKKQCYGVQRATYNDFNYLEEDTFELVRFTRSILKNYNFNESSKFTVYTEQGLPAVRFYATNDQGAVMDAKVLIKGVHYFFVYQISDKSGSRDQHFLDSFSITEFKTVNPIREIKDKEMLFTARDEVTDNALSRFNEIVSKAYESAQQKRKDSTEKDQRFRNGNKLYYSPSSNEYVNITFEKYDDYDYRRTDELEKKLDNVFSAGSSMFVAARKSNFDGKQFSYQCDLRDTATRRAIRVLVFFRNSTMHEVSCQYDTVLGLQGYPKIFMESFAPMDSAAGPNIFENKFKALLSSLISADTARRNRANEALTTLGLHRDFREDLIDFIKRPEFKKVSEESRGQLIVNGGTLGSDEIIAPYKQLYKQYTDSFYLQLCILKGLAYRKSSSSFAAFSELLQKEPPLVGAQNTIDDIFSVLHDSLELCPQFFPGFLTLAKYDEYRDAVYRLLGELVHSQPVDPVIYLSKMNNILDDANLALKRYNPGSANAVKLLSGSQLDHLDRNLRDIAENIQGNLEGLSNNNFYKGSDHLRVMTSAMRAPLINYALVLAPFYKSDPRVQQFIDKLSKIKSQEINMPLVVLMLKQDVKLNDTSVSYYSSNKFTRAYFFSELEKEKLTSKFDRRYLDQKSLIESVLISQKQMNNYYMGEKEKSKKDSLVLVTERSAVNKYQKGKIYVYKNIRKNEEDLWSAVFVNDDSLKVTSRIELVNAGFLLDHRKSENENIEYIVDHFSLAFRKRAQGVSGLND
jgi:uncharacterized protein YbaP (TraB family)